MSQQKRKITYWSLRFLDDNDEISFDKTLFSRFLDYMNTLTRSRKVLTSPNSKAAVLSHSNKVQIGSETLYDIIFQSCKFNHSPDYMSSTTGEERRSDKRLDEGDEELTHLCMRLLPGSAYTLLEERRSGISMTGIINYLNAFWQEYIRTVLPDVSLKLSICQILNEDFLSSLDQTIRIARVSIYTNKTILGSGFLNLLELDHDAQDDIELCIKSKRKRSLPKEPLKELFSKIVGGETRINRIHVQGKNVQNMNVIFDSMNIRRNEEIVVALLPNGIVDTTSVFSEMHRIIMEGT